MSIIKTSIAQGTTPAAILTAGVPVKSVIISNHSDATVYVSPFGDSDVTGASGTKPGVPIAAGANLVLLPGSFGDVTAKGPIYGVHDGTGAKVVSVSYQPFHTLPA